MKPFRVTGKFRMGRTFTPFTVETLAADDAGAKDRVFSTLGSRHRVNRHQVSIETVKAIAAADVTDAVVEKRLSMVK